MWKQTAKCNFSSFYICRTVTTAINWSEDPKDTIWLKELIFHLVRYEGHPFSLNEVTSGRDNVCIFKFKEQRIRFEMTNKTHKIALVKLCARCISYRTIRPSATNKVFPILVSLIFFLVPQLVYGTAPFNLPANQMANTKFIELGGLRKRTNECIRSDKLSSNSTRLSPKYSNKNLF